MKKNCTQADNSRSTIANKMIMYTKKRSICNIRGRSSVELCGCCGMITYKDELMEIMLCDSLIRICGQSLTLKHFYGGRMVIFGVIDSVEYRDCQEVVI